MPRTRRGGISFDFSLKLPATTFAPSPPPSGGFPPEFCRCYVPYRSMVVRQGAGMLTMALSLPLFRLPSPPRPRR